MNSSKGDVLVTGGSGYIAGWCIVELLRRGYRVRTTVRSLARIEEVKASVAREARIENLSFFLADLKIDAGWEEIASGCEYVIHVASPFPASQPKNPDEVIVPARDGTIRVLRASSAAGVKRIVITSSASAIGYVRQIPLPEILTEEQWIDPTHPDATPYVRSKTIAERVAWDFMHGCGEEKKLSVVAPGTVIGPLLDTHVSFSVQLIERMLNGSVPALPRIGFSLVDVRDIADLHIRAMTDPAAGGERFLGATDFLWMEDVARILRRRLGVDAEKVPSRRAPAPFLRVMSLFDAGLRSILPELGKRRAYSGQKARRVLGWSPRAVEDTIVDCARSLLRVGRSESPELPVAIARVPPDARKSDEA
jgi:nucleoside-diphosphate-sugar epimerase